MINPSKNHTAQICEIANRLADNYVKPLYNFCTEKNYYVYIGILIEIIDWAHEFDEQYQDKINDWEAFKKSSDNIYTAATPYEFLMAWGNDRANKFFISNTTEYENSGSGEDNKTAFQIKPSVKTGTVRKAGNF